MSSSEKKKKKKNKRGSFKGLSLKDIMAKRKSISESGNVLHSNTKVTKSEGYVRYNWVTALLGRYRNSSEMKVAEHLDGRLRVERRWTIYRSIDISGKRIIYKYSVGEYFIDSTRRVEF